MMFNPSAWSNWIWRFGDYVGGGKHFIYVFRNSAKYSATGDPSSMVGYKYGEFFLDKFRSQVSGQTY